MTNHVMVDLETVDNIATAGIVSIGAYVFYGPQAGDTFYQAVDLQSCLDAGLSQSHETMQRWGMQSFEAQAVFTDPDRVPLREALSAFGTFMIRRDAPSVRVWGNGASFDNAILAHAYRKTGLMLPWRFWNDRCYRTVAACISARREQKGTHHNALDDAISQAEHLLTFGPGAVINDV